MRIEDLANLGAEALEKLTDKQLDEILRPYYPQTRPELISKPKPKQQEMPVYIDPKKRAALELLKEEGIDVSFMDRKFKKK